MRSAHRLGLYFLLGWSSLLAQARRQPANPIYLRNPRLEAVLDGSDGVPYGYNLRASKALIRGEDSGRLIDVTVFHRQTHEFRQLQVRPANVEVEAAQADFHFNVRDGGAQAVAFTLRYAITDATLRVSLEEVSEKPGWELIEVALPDLATIREEDGPTWLAHGDSGGSTVTLAKATPGHLAKNRFWGGVAATLPVAMIGTDKVICVEEVTAFMDTTELAVDGEPGHRRAKLGTIKVYRINGSVAQDMNTGGDNPRVAGNDKTPNLLVGQRSMVRLDFIADFDGNGVVDWLDGAKFTRAHMPPIPTHYFDDKFQYSVHSDEPKFPKAGATFAETEKIVRQVANLTAFNPQTVYLWGWQYRGKDTGYPAVDQLNPRVGTYDELQQLIAHGREVNATVSFSDNFDDAYRSSPAWDEAYIARRPDGELWQSRNWTGEDSYIIGLAKYMAGPGAARIKYTCDHYKLRDTYLVDVLSYYAIRNDWDPEHPASGIKNLEARFKILEGLRACGLEMVSEELRYPFIGKLAVADNGPVGAKDPFGGDDIPLAATIYRQSAIWGLRGPQKRDNSALHTFFYNGHGFPWITAETNLEDFVEFFWQTIVPWYQTHYKNIETFHRDGDRTVIGLEGNSKIDIDWKTGQYAITVNGAEVARDGDTFCPIGNDRIAFYSRTAKRMLARLPADWDTRRMAAFELYADHVEPVPGIGIGDGKVSVRVPARRAVVLFRDGAGPRPSVNIKPSGKKDASCDSSRTRRRQCSSAASSRSTSNIDSRPDRCAPS
jgi:hypothetical protein